MLLKQVQVNHTFIQENTKDELRIYGSFFKQTATQNKPIIFSPGTCLRLPQLARHQRHLFKKQNPKRSLCVLHWSRQDMSG